MICFDVNCQMVRTSLHEGLDESLRMLNHEMGIQTPRGTCDATPPRDRPHGQVGNKVTIHTSSAADRTRLASRWGPRHPVEKNQHQAWTRPPMALAVRPASTKEMLL